MTKKHPYLLFEEVRIPARVHHHTTYTDPLRGMTMVHSLADLYSTHHETHEDRLVQSDMGGVDFTSSGLPSTEPLTDDVSPIKPISVDPILGRWRGGLYGWCIICTDEGGGRMLIVVRW